jgi:PAS domain S-box-containing protein
MREIWADVHVGASSLYTALYQLRAALRSIDPAFAPITTLRGYGFLFTEAVEAADDGEVVQSERDRQLLAAYGALASEGLWCFDLERPLRVSLPEPALAEALCDAKLSFCNASLAATYGYREPAELLGRRVTDFVVRDRPENLAYLRDVLREGSVRGAISLEVDRSGKPRWISNDVTCVVHGEEILRICGMQRDVTGARSAHATSRALHERRGRELARALVEIQRLSQQALAALGRGETSADAWLTEAHQRADQLRKMLE